MSSSDPVGFIRPAAPAPAVAAGTEVTAAAAVTAARGVDSRRRLWLGAGLMAAAGLGGCGFRLRGTADLPFTTLYAGFTPNSEIGALFRRELVRRTRTRLVDRPENAEVVLQVLSENREKDTVAYSGVGRPRLYELRQRLYFRAYDGGDIEYIAPSEIILRRDISAADNQLTARVDEEVILFRDMQDDMVSQLLRRLEAIRLDRPDTSD